MASGFEYTEIGTWLSDLPDGLVESIGQESAPTAGFSFVVRADPVDVSVIGPGGEGPLVIESTVSFPEEVLAAIRENSDQFFAETSSILASAPGFHQFTDGDGNTAGVESFSAAVLRHYVYPDGATKHAVLTGVVDLLTAATHLHDAGDRLANAAREP